MFLKRKSRTVEQGIVYVTYDTGPWVAIKMRGNKFHGWLGVGSARFDFNVNRYDDYDDL